MKTQRTKAERTVALLATVVALFTTSYHLEIQSVEAFSTRDLPISNNAKCPSRRIAHRAIPFITSLQQSKGDRLSVSSSSSSPAGTLSPALNPIEAWCITHMDVLYSKSLSIKCPFMRRRSADFLDGMDMVMRFLIIRHKSLPLIGPPPGCRSLSSDDRSASSKSIHLPLADIMETVRQDWKPYNNHKGYYITGRLNTTIYRDDCVFDGPDPDMPVRGLRKYLNAASQLFDTATSSAELLSLELGTVRQSSNTTITSTMDKKVLLPKTEDYLLPKHTHATIVARWQLQGVLHLPWHPSLPTWTGTTVYHLDESHLVYRHEEFWDISVLQAFTQTLWPQVGNRIWNVPAEDPSHRPSVSV